MVETTYENRKRLKFNIYASRTAYQRLRKAIENNDDHEIYAATGELLLWIINIDKWFLEHGNSDYKKIRNTTPSGQIIKGLSYAYNSLKHNMEIFTIHNKEGGLQFPIEFPLEFPPLTVKWINAANKLDGGYENQRKNYIRFVQGKELLTTFEAALTLLNQESQKILFKQ